MEQIWEGVLGDGLVGNFWEEGLPLCAQSKFECLHGCCGHNILWQLVPLWVFSDAQRMLATTSLTPLLVNRQSMTSKPNAGGGSKAGGGQVVKKTTEAMIGVLGGQCNGG